MTAATSMPALAHSFSMSTDSDGAFAEASAAAVPDRVGEESIVGLNPCS